MNTSTWSYNTLSNQPSDFVSRYVNKIIKGISLVLINFLSVSITIVKESGYTANVIGIIGPKGKLEIADENISNGDFLHFMYNNSFACPSHNVDKKHGNILIGNVTVLPGIYKRDIHPGGDISSINIHNLLPWPLVISMGHRPVAYIQGNTDLGNKNHHGDLNVAPVVYFDNLNHGINIGAEFNVQINTKVLLDKTIPSELYSFVINDINTHEVFIGNVGVSIDYQSTTGVIDTGKMKNTGTPIYRIGEGNTLTEHYLDEFTNSGVVRGHNYPGNDIHRSTIHSSKRSTVPTARYLKLSGANVICQAGL